MSAARTVEAPAGLALYGFAQHGDPLDPACCMWCGRKLRALQTFNQPERMGRRGDYGDNAFCGLRCGYAFGWRLAQLGERLRPAK